MAETSLSAYIQSTCLEPHVVFNGDTQELEVTYQGGATYTYLGVSLEDARGLVRASSKGKFVNAVIKRSYGFRKG